MIRHELEIILGEELRFLAIRTRERLGFTQKEMVKQLWMSESSYSDLETGRTKCSALSAVLLLDMQEEPTDFLNTVDKKFEQWYAKEMLSV